MRRAEAASDTALTKSKSPRGGGSSDAQARKRRRRPRTVARHEIRKYRTNRKYTDKHLIPKARIERIVRKITSEHDPSIRYKRDAVEVIHRAAEDYLTELFTRASVTAFHSKREMTMLKDLDLVRWLSGDIPFYRPCSGTEEALNYPVHRSGKKPKKRPVTDLSTQHGTAPRNVPKVPTEATADYTDEDEVY